MTSEDKIYARFRLRDPNYHYVPIFEAFDANLIFEVTCFAMFPLFKCSCERSNRSDGSANKDKGDKSRGLKIIFSPTKKDLQGKLSLQSMITLLRLL